MAFDAHAVVSEYVAARWMKRTLDQSQRVMVWVAMLDGEIVFSRGGGLRPGHFVGHKLGRDYGANTEFFLAMDRLVGGEAEEFMQVSIGQPDNPHYAGVPFLNCYTLIRTPSGQPTAVAVTSIRLEGMDVYNSECPFRVGGACRA